MTHSRLIVAIDTPDLEHAKTLAGLVGPHCGMLKLGLEFFAAQGAAGVRAIAGRPVFLDLKLHDIPNTVAGAVRGLLPLAPAMLTVHAAGGTAMIAAARQAAGDGEGRPLLLAVTVLTSLDAEALAETGVEGMPVQQVVRLARLALAAGADGLVCSPHEIVALRAEFGREPVLVVPGIRPPQSRVDDQSRVMTPQAALAVGASWIVVGRPITAAADPAAAAQALLS